jgi:DNA mismatch repair protein MutS
MEELRYAVACMDDTVRKIVEIAPSAAEDSVRMPADAAATFRSILFETDEDRAAAEARDAPGFFPDLNCDQIVEAVTAGRDEYDLKPFFYACLRRRGAIEYRHEVMRDLERPLVLERVNAFAQPMRAMREDVARAEKLYYKEHKHAWFLDAVRMYCDAVAAFAEFLSGAELRSPGFLGFSRYLNDYVRSIRFTSLRSETEKLKADLANVRYSVLIKGSSFTVMKYQSESDYSAEVELTFEKFKRGAAEDYRVRFREDADMNHIEAKVLDFVAKLHPEVFVPLEEYCRQNANYVDGVVAAYDREIQFYVAYLEYLAPLKRAGLPFCYPEISDDDKEVRNVDGFDIALAQKLHAENGAVVCNDFHLTGPERVLVISGPNQGGKTTFARAFGQLHYLANIGLPVPGRSARLLLFDSMFTQFEKEEKVENLRGKLEDDLIRMHDILARTTSRSIIIMNEVFTSTTIQDELFLSEKVMERVIDLDLLCVWVTFADELASFAPQTVSMVSTVVPENPALRTFKIVRRPADGLAYALAIAQKHRVTYESIRERMKR